MRKLRLFLFAGFLFLLLSALRTPVNAAYPPDIIHLMEVTITPQTDGSLNIHYRLDYEATTDFPRDIQYLEIGVPNSDFTLLDYGPTSLIDKGKENKGSNSQVHLDFNELPKEGDRFVLDFTINQRSMIYQAGEAVAFQFRPGWFDFAVINEMRVNVDVGKLISVHYSPTGADANDTFLTWVTTDMEVNEKTDLYTITCDRGSFPDLQNSDLSIKPNGNSSDSLFVSLFFGIIIVGAIILIYKASKYQKEHGYPAGRYGGSYRGGGIVGGHHTFHGGGGGCACACACACAGGGRVGCSERGYQVLYWLTKRTSQHAVTTTCHSASLNTSLDREAK